MVKNFVYLGGRKNNVPPTTSLQYKDSLIKLKKKKKSLQYKVAASKFLVLNKHFFHDYYIFENLTFLVMRVKGVIKIKV